MKQSDAQRAWRARHKNHIAKYMVAYNLRNREVIAAGKVVSNRRRELYQRVRAQLKLGGKCVRCGFDHDYRALQIDHIAGGGSRRRLKHDPIKDILAGNTKKYQLLCANCNWIKRYEMNEVYCARS